MITATSGGSFTEACEPALCCKVRWPRWLCVWGWFVLLGTACAPADRVERAAPARAQASKSPMEPAKHSPKRQEPQPRTVTLPGITVDLSNRELQVEGQVCITAGVLEYVAVAAGGKEYESIFSLNCRPSHLQVALLIAGYEAGEVVPQARGDFAPGVDGEAIDVPEGAPQGTAPPEDYWRRPQGHPTDTTFDVEIRTADGTWRRYPVTAFLVDRRTGTTPEPMSWAFTGSFFYRDPDTGLEAYIGDLEKSVIALWYDPAALFNLFQDVGNPYRGDASGLEANANALPPKGTPVRLIIRPVDDRAR